MTISAFGFVRPLQFNKIKKGMLVLAAPADGQRYFGVTTDIRDDKNLVILLASDGDAPAAIDLGYMVDDLWEIPGVLEVEPTDAPFSPLKRRMSSSGYAMTSDGNIAAKFLHNSGGRTLDLLINLSDGQHMERADSIAFFTDPKFFIRQEGRKERFACAALVSPQEGGQAVSMPR